MNTDTFFVLLVAVGALAGILYMAIIIQLIEVVKKKKEMIRQLLNEKFPGSGDYYIQLKQIDK